MYFLFGDFHSFICLEQRSVMAAADRSRKYRQQLKDKKKKRVIHKQSQDLFKAVKKKQKRRDQR
jgi:hypothetical protein